jgi:dolichyl-phosphate beta-glucosyltransferase
MTGSQSGALSLSLVVPAFNESLRLADGLARINGAIALGAIVPSTTEFVIVDDGSSDDTAGRAAELFGIFPHVQIIRLPDNKGKGAAVRAGVAAARGAVIAFADADMAIDPAQTPEFLAALTTSDIAIGTRAAVGASVDRPNLRRSVMNRAFNQMVNAMTRLSLQDTQCGFKAFRAPVAKLLFHCSVTERFAFDVEVLMLARRLGFDIGEVPVHWLRVEGSRIRPVADAISMARDVFRATRGSVVAPSVVALSVQVPSTTSRSVTDQVVASLSAGLPVIEGDEGSVVVLCPMMTDGGITLTVNHIGDAIPGAAIEKSLLTVTQLGDLAPLVLPWDKGAKSPIAP